MTDLTTCLTWKGRTVWLRELLAEARRQTGDIVYVGTAFMVAGDVDVAVQLENGEVRMVRASQRGELWDFSRPLP
jgi:hypothetical protein